MSTIIPGASGKQVFTAWMDSKQHGEFTGDVADIQLIEGGSFSIFSGYITGSNLELHPDSIIIQAWRTTEFPENAPDSRLEIRLENTLEGCKLTLYHKGLPEDQVESYREGWQNFYFKPLEKYFLNK
jgi:activator of HSP90 ATPase